MSRRTHIHPPASFRSRYSLLLRQFADPSPFDGIRKVAHTTWTVSNKLSYLSGVFIVTFCTDAVKGGPKPLTRRKPPVAVVISIEDHGR